MSRFGPIPHDFFDAIYQDIAPWDIGGPQPALTDLWAANPPTSPILDVGCGSGDVAIALAQQGFEVLGVDFVETAIALAQRKAAALPPTVSERLQFRVADALQPSRLHQQFGAVVDCGFFHLFDPQVGARFVDELTTTLRPGGCYYLLAFSTEFDIPNVPRGVSVQEVRALFTVEKGWQIRALHDVLFHSRVAPPVPAIAACIERLA